MATGLTNYAAGDGGYVANRFRKQLAQAAPRRSSHLAGTLLWFNGEVIVGDYSKRELQRLAEEQGAVVSFMATPDLTHMVARALGAESTLRRRFDVQSPPACVYPEWIVECHKSGKRLPEADFEVEEVRARRMARGLPQGQTRLDGSRRAKRVHDKIRKGARLNAAKRDRLAPRRAGRSPATVASAVALWGESELAAPPTDGSRAFAPLNDARDWR